MNNGLKRCPFCGGGAARYVRMEYNPVGYIGCDACGTRTCARVIEGRYGSGDPAIFENRVYDKLADDWNNRVKEDE